MNRRCLSVILIYLIISYLTGCSLENSFNKSTENNKESNNFFSYYGTYGNLELLEELTDTYDISQNDLNSALYNASNCMGNDYSVMSLIISKGADADTNDLVWECAYNNKENQLYAVLSDTELDINKRNNDNMSALAQAVENINGEDYTAYRLCNRLIENGAEIYPELFEEKSLISKTKAPRTVSMLINRYLENGGKLNIPESYKYALSGNISKCLEYAVFDDLSDDQKNIILCFALYYGTVEEFKKLEMLFSQELEIEQFMYKHIASCGNVEMFDYVLDKTEKHIRFDPKTDSKDGSDSSSEIQLEYCNIISDSFNSAAYFDEFEMCKHFIDNGFRPFHGIEDYTALEAALFSQDIELFRLIYEYVNNEMGDLTERELAGSNGVFPLRSKADWSYNEITDFEKQAIDIVLADGWKLENMYYSFMNDSHAEYFISQGASLSDDAVIDICQMNNINALQAIIDKGYDIKPEILTLAIQYASSDMIEMILDSGTKMEDNILEDSYLASKATVKLLIDRGAKTDIVIKRLSSWGNKGGRNGKFGIKDVYKHRGRVDLIELVE